MSRRIVETQLQSSQPSSKEIDGYFSKIMKYIPSEIVGAWIAIQGIATNIDGINDIVLWGIILFLVILTFFYIQQQTSETDKKIAIKQISISVGAFAVWICAIGGKPFESLEFYNSAYGSILMILYTVTIPIIPLNQD